MVLPLNLAMTAAEMSHCDPLPQHPAWMACHFSPYGPGISNIPTALPPGTMLILNDWMACQSHSPGLTAQQLQDIVDRFQCESVLLDFQRPIDAEIEAMARHLVQSLPCPVAVTESCSKTLDCPVFLSPGPLHVPLEEHIAPWQGRELWLEAALCQELVTVTESGTSFAPQFPPDRLDGGFFDEELCCNYRTEILDNKIRFTLFDTPDSLTRKLEKAHSLGIKRAVGLYQELGK